MIKINLLPKEIQQRGKVTEWVLLGCCLSGLFVFVFMTSYLLKLQSYKRDLAKKARWSQQLTDIKNKVAQVEQLDAQKSVLNAKKSTVVQLLQWRLLYPKLMETFYRTLPQDIWLTELTLSEDEQKNIRIVAHSNSLTTNAIADWLETLESKPDRFSEIVLSAIESKHSADTKLSSFGFSLSFVYHPPPETIQQHG